MSKTTQPQSAARKKPRWGRRLAVFALVVVVLLIAAVLALPPIASAVAPGQIEAAVNPTIKGSIEVEKVKLSLFGGQQAGPIRVLDAKGQTLGTVQATAGVTGLSLITGNFDLGELRISGDLSVTRAADGTIDLAEAFAPTNAPPKQPNAGAAAAGAAAPSRLPGSLAAKIVVDKIDLTYTDAALADATGKQIGAMALRDLVGEIDVAMGQPLTGSFTGSIRSGMGRDSLNEDGPLTLTFDLNDWSASDGTLTLDAASGQLALDAQARDATVNAAIDVTDGVATLQTPATASVDLQPWASRLVAVQDAIANTPGLTIETFPEAKLTVDSLRVELPKGGSALNLRSATAHATFTVGSLSGSADPSAMGLAGGSRQPFTTQPTSVELTLADDQTAKLSARGSANVGDQSAGTLNADFTFAEYFDASGGPTVPRRIAGSAKVQNVATAILDPFVAALLQREGEPLVRLTEDLGPTLSVALDAATINAEEGGEGNANAVRLTGNLTSANVRGSLDVALSETSLTAPAGDALVLNVQEPAPLLRRVIPQVRLSHADPVSIKVTSLTADLQALKGPSPDLRTTSAVATLETGTIAGSVTDAEGNAKAFGAGPFTGTLDASALSDGRLSLSLNGSGGYDGRSAGTLSVNGSATNLLNETGGVRTGAVPQVDLTASLADINTALLAAFVPLEETGLDPARDIGPTLNASLTATNPSADELRADLSVTSEHLNVSGPISINKQRITALEPLTITQTRPTTLLSAVSRIDPPLTTVLDRPALIRATIKEFTLPLDDKMAPQPQNATLSASLLLQNMQSSGVVISRVTGDANLTPKDGVSVTGQLVAAHSGKPFSGSLEARAPRVFNESGTALPPMEMKPLAKLELRDAPPALARFIPKGPPGPDGRAPIDLAALINDFTGGAFTVLAEFDAQSESQAVTANIDSPLTTLNAKASLNDQTLSTETITLNTRITANALNQVMSMGGSAPAQLPSLTEPASLSVRIEPFKLPLTESFAPDSARASDELRLSGTIAATVDGVGEGAANQGPIALRDGTFSLRGPLAALLGAGRGQLNAQASGKVNAARGASGSFTLNTSPTLEAGKPAGPFAINATLTDVPVSFIDSLAGQPGLIEGAVGPSLSLELAADVDTTAATPVNGLSLGVRSQRVNTSKPLKITASGETLRLASPAEMSVVLEPAWANRYLLGANAQQPAAQPGGAAPPPPLMQLTKPANITLKLNSLVLPAQMAGTEGSPGGPLKLGTFSINAEVDLPDTSLAVGEAKTPVGITGGVLTLKPTSVQNGTLDYDLRVSKWTASGRESNAQQPSRVWGTLFGLASASGEIQPQTLRATGSFELPNVPTALVDAFARNDLPSKALGETVTAKGWYREISSIAGAFRFEANSPNATAAAEGSFNRGFMLINKPADGQPVASISRITPALTSDLSKALPLLKSLEKTSEDEPAKLTLDTNISVPIDGNMNNLSGYFSLNMGTGRFIVQNQFLGMIKVPGLNEQGRVGKRLNTLKVVMDRGVIAYQPYTLPVGEFDFLSVGVVNLSDRAWESKEADLKAGPGGTVDVITYIPGGALAQEVAGPLGVPLGIGPQVMAPFRTRGPLDNTKTSFAAEHFAKKNLTPENIIKGTGDLLGEPGKIIKDILGGGGK